MLTVAYCRVSTEEQVAEGFSIAGQAEKLRDYARLHDLGEVTIVTDPGASGKDMDRPGLQQVLGMVSQGHVRHVLIWRLDRLSRNMGDLILLADTFGKADVALHSFSERIDLSSATGRMFYNILGSFAQFYREQLSENVSMGMQQAARQGRWTNRPKFGYDLISGELVPNADAPIVQRMFQLRTQGYSYREIGDQTGVKYSSVASILKSRIYLGEVLYSGDWYPGRHQALIASGEFEAAHRGHIPGRRRGKQLLSGRVRCGLCGRVASVHWGSNGALFRCRHRGEGCTQRARSASGLERAALLGMRLLSEDRDLQESIRSEVSRVRGDSGASNRGTRRKVPGAGVVTERRRKLLDLYYAGHISAEGFAEEEGRLARSLRAVQRMEDDERRSEQELAQIADQFEELARILRVLDIDALWEAATDRERRELIEELVQSVVIFPDHLEVEITGAPKLNVLLSEVGLKEELQTGGVGGGT